MKEHRVGFSIVVICMLLLSVVGIAKAQNDAFKDVEERAAKAFETTEAVKFDSRQSLKLNTEFGVKFTQAQVIYKEHVSAIDTDSEWEAWLSRGDVLASVYYETNSGNKMGLDVDFGLFRTTTEEEEWNTEGGSNQTNDTELSGWELKLGLGYVQEFESPWEIKHVVSYGRRVLEFERRNFNVDEVQEYLYSGLVSLDLPPVIPPVKEKFIIDYLEYSPKISFNKGEKWSFSFKPGFAYMLGAEAHNDFIGENIDAEYGIIASLDAKVTYQFTELFGAYIGALGEWQYIEGDTIKDGTVEWPDNDLYTYGVMVGITFNL